jgi:AcrR family transcriptional regulator
LASKRALAGPAGEQPVSLEVRERILQGAFDCVARFGISKTTIQDVARASGVSRATLYRYFPGGREDLIASVISWETTRFFLRLYQEVAAAHDLEEVLTIGLSFARRAVVGHEVLQRVLSSEPELLLPHLTVDATRVVDLIAAFLRPMLLSYGLSEGSQPGPGETADFLARMILSYVMAPGRWDLEDQDQLERLVRDQLLAGIREAVGKGS